MLVIKILLCDQACNQLLYPLSPISRLQILHILDIITHIITPILPQQISPTARRKTGLSIPPQQLIVYLVKHRVLTGELPGKRCIACDHFGEVIEGKEVGMLLWGVVPGDEMEVVVDSRVAKIRGVADDSVEVTFR